MGLIRTILTLLILLILFHVGMVYVGVKPDTNGLTGAIYGLGALVESPAAALLDALPLSPQLRGVASANSFFAVALTAAACYFILYLLLGVGRRG